jgi:hypothetical protein
MNAYLKRCLPDILVVVVFALISFVYFMPADLDGRILYREDSQAGRGAGMEINHYRNKTGETTRWTNSIFSGMPTYQMAPSYKSDNVLDQTMRLYHLWLPDNVWYVFRLSCGLLYLTEGF